MIGGKVIDSSALAAYVRGSVAMDSWLAVAKELGIVLYVPALAVIEVRTVCAVYPHTDTLLARLLDHPSVIHSVLSSADARKVIHLLDESGAWDGIAGHVILMARQRGWPVLTTDPDRLRRIVPDLHLDLL
ncbi:MAG TPA: PIN domain-containing protein [Pseudonocardiaceae bacterium]|nr:PIN domain-containing protein [Pseudonocardiaceae bacterium]